jgi:hypothetical protein
MAAAIAAIRSWRTRSAGTAGAAFEATGRSAAAVASAAIGTSATPAAIPPATAATLRPLKARARIAANTRGVALEFFARSRCTGNARSASLAGEENYIVFDNRFAAATFVASGRDCLGIVVDVFLRDSCIGRRCLMNCAIVRGVGLGFGAFRGGAGFGLLLGAFRFFFGMNFFGSVFGGFVLFFFFKLRATNDGIGFGVGLRFLMLGFDDIRGKSSENFFAQPCSAVARRLCNCFFGRAGFTFCGLFVAGGGTLWMRFGRFTARAFGF